MTAPGLYPDVPEQQYHADKRSLSVSGAKKLLPPSCPAIFKWQRDHGQPHKRAFDFGHAAHAKVLGVGAEIVTVEAENWMTKAAKAQRDEAYAAGKVPLLPGEVAQVEGMAAAIKAHPTASALFDPDHGVPEQSLYWHDEEFDITRRGRLDWLGESYTADGRLIVPDYKTCVSADLDSIAKAVANFGYAQQDDWYSEGIRALGLAEDVAFVFVFQQKTAPYPVTVVELDETAKRYGRAKNRQAMAVYAECQATDTWPGFADDVALISLPKWATYGMDLYA